MSVDFLFDQVLTCAESATPECSTTSQGLDALLGRSRRLSLSWTFFLVVVVMPPHSWPFFCFKCCASTQLALQVHQERTQAVCSNKEALKLQQERHKWEGLEAEQKRSKIKKIILVPSPKKKPSRAGWPKRLGLVRATPWADFAVSGDQL